MKHQWFLLTSLLLLGSNSLQAQNIIQVPYNPAWPSPSWDGNQFIAYGKGFLGSSPDGLDWSFQEVPLVSGYVQYDPTSHLFVQKDGDKILTSDDYINWTLVWEGDSSLLLSDGLGNWGMNVGTSVYESSDLVNWHLVTSVGENWITYFYRTGHYFVWIGVDPCTKQAISRAGNWLTFNSWVEVVALDETIILTDLYGDSYVNGTLLDPSLTGFRARGQFFVAMEQQEAGIPVRQTLSFDGYHWAVKADYPDVGYLINDYWFIRSGSSLSRQPHCEIAIFDQPEDRLASLEDVVVFSVAVQATHEVSYQWLRDGVELVGETRAELSFRARPESWGSYTCRIYNDCDEITSDPARLEVSQIWIDEAFPDVEGCEGNFVVLAPQVSSNDELHYQWYRDGLALPNTQPYLEFDISQASIGLYRLEASNNSGASLNISVSVNYSSSGQRQAYLYPREQVQGDQPLTLIAQQTCFTQPANQLITPLWNWPNIHRITLPMASENLPMTLNFYDQAQLQISQTGMIYVPCPSIAVHYAEWGSQGSGPLTNAQVDIRDLIQILPQNCLVTP